MEPPTIRHLGRPAIKRPANRPCPPTPPLRRLAHLLVDRLSAISVTGASEV